MASNNSTTYVDLDFDTIKGNLKEFLRGNDRFKDYDFEGSNLSVLLDLLAYNTHKTAFYQNMVMAESFLDSAQLRASIVSHAKDLNYTPIGYRSARAQIRVKFTSTAQNQPYIIEKGSLFSTLVRNQSYTFCMPETLTVSSTSTQFQFDTYVDEGFFVKDSFVFIDNDELQRFKLTNTTIDTSSITVAVYEDGSDTPEIYVRTDTLLGLNKNSKVYFLQATGEGYYEVLFGDGIFGRKPKINSAVVVDYRICHGPDANGAKTFDLGFDLTNGTDRVSAFSVETLQTAQDGALPQTSERIRIYAPRYFAAQQRAIGSDDYKSLILAQFGNVVDDVISYGGETTFPKLYGRVVLALKPITGTVVPDYVKAQVEQYLLQRAGIPMRTKIVDPQYVYCDVSTTVQYNTSVTKKTQNEIKSAVLAAILAYSRTSLQAFDNDFRYSKFIRTIDDCDASITSNDTAVRMIKRLVPSPYIATSFDLKLANQLRPASSLLSDPTVTGSTFTYVDADQIEYPLAFIQDDGAGKLVVCYYNGVTKIVLNNNIGSVNYLTGDVMISQLIATNYGTYIKLYAKLANKDIVINQQNVLVIDPEDVAITVIGTLQ